MRASIHSGSKSHIKSSSRAGFTLIEILITLAILGILSAVMIGYTAESGRQTTLLLARESIVQLLNRAKSNSLAAYSSTGNDLVNNSGMSTCGYGVHINPTTGSMNVFESEASSTDGCTNRSDFAFSSNTDQFLPDSLDSYNMNTNTFSIIPDPNGDLTDVVFTSPNLATYIYTEEDQSGSSTIGGINLHLIGSATSDSVEVDVNNAGQISSQ